jgi:hypothetical protein
MEEGEGEERGRVEIEEGGRERKREETVQTRASRRPI